MPVTISASTPDRDVVSGAVVGKLPIIVDGAYQVSEGDPVRTAASK